MRKLVVHCVPQWGLGGVWTAACQLVANLSGRQGMRMRTVAVGRYSPRDGLALADSAVTFVTPLRASIRDGLLGTDVEATESIVCHLHSLWHPELAMIAGWCRRSGVPYVVSPHGALDAWALNKARAKKAAALLAYQRWVLAGAAVVHCLTEREAVDVRRVVRRPHCIVAPNGIDVHSEWRMSESRDWSTSSGVPELRVLFLSRLDPKKNIEAAIDAVAALAAEGMRVSLRIVGTGDRSYEQSLRQRIVELGAEAAISMVGAVHGEAKQCEYAKAQAFVLPSFSEGLSMAVLEALAAGTPVILSAAADVGGVLQSGAGLICGVRAEDLEAALRRLMGEDAQQRATRSRAARALVEERFSWDVLRSTYSELYRSALDE